VALLTNRVPHVTRLAEGVYRVEHDGRADVVYVAGSPGDRWAFWNGHVFHGSFGAPPRAVRRAAGASGAQLLTAPMPATVIKVLIQPGAAVKKGDTLVLLEAMKMELPLRALSDATVVAVHCRERDLVQPDTVLVELQ
jgi:acetyl/propionyl-CoA carboxylase alpha subunit